MRIKKCAACLLIIATLAVSASAATIDVGAIELLENTPNQPVPIWIDGGEPCVGMNFTAQIADGGSIGGGPTFSPFDPPASTPLDLLTDTIWDSGMVFELDPSVLPGGQLLVGGVVVGDEVPAEGLLATMYVDTTGWFANHPADPWDLTMTDTIGDDISIFDGQGAPLDLAVSPGTLTLVPAAEPSTLVMLLTLVVSLVCFGVCRLFRGRGRN